MLKKIILAGATASLIAVSSLAAMTGTAAAAPYPYPQPQYDNGYNGNQAYDQDWFRNHKRFDDCRPIVRAVKWYDRLGFPHLRTIKVADRCDFRGPNMQPYWGH